MIVHVENPRGNCKQQDLETVIKMLTLCLVGINLTQDGEEKKGRKARKM